MMHVTRSIFKWLLVLLCLSQTFVFAADAPEGFFMPAKGAEASWVFSGMVSNENDEHYHYFFQIQRDGYAFHAIVALLDAKTKQVLFKENSHAFIEHPDNYDWRIGRAFMRFNAINDSWIFGIQDDRKAGFNFKVDMLNQHDHEVVTRYFRHGVSFVVMQTGSLNGHLQWGDEKEQFVTGKNAWFRQIWLTKAAQEPHQLDGLLCRFQDGSGLYSVKLLESDVTRGAVSGLLDDEGNPSAISQFIHIESQEDHSWLIRAISPHLSLQVTPALQQQEVIAGFTVNKNQPGFCLLSRDVMGAPEKS